MTYITGDSDVPRYAYVNALRGYAVLGVVATHTPALAPDLPSIVRRYADFGGNGVALFFLVSALTLSFSWRSRNDNDVYAFYIRRFFRIAPAFWLAIILYSIFPWPNRSYWAPNGVSNFTILLTAVFLNGWHPETINSVVPGGWSIAVESGFYVVFPILVSWIRSFRTALLCCLVSLGGTATFGPISIEILARCYQETPLYLVTIFEGMWLPSTLYIFIAGIGCWFSVASMRVRRRFAEAEVLIAVALIALMPILPPSGGDLKNNLTPLIFTILIHGLACGGGRYLINPAIQRIGIVSFSMYLWHFAVIMSVKNLGVSLNSRNGASYFMFLLLVLAITWILSEVTYRMIERPMINVGNRLIKFRLNEAAPSRP